MEMVAALESAHTHFEFRITLANKTCSETMMMMTTTTAYHTLNMDTFSQTHISQNAQMPECYMIHMPISLGL